MLEEIIIPGFYETDALGHINNTVVPMWFEKTRAPVFRLFTPDLDPKKWALIIVKIEVEYLRQISYQEPVTIKTGIGDIGNSSFVIRQELFQEGEQAARGQSTMVHFDYAQQKSAPLTEDIRSELEKLQ